MKEIIEKVIKKTYHKIQEKKKKIKRIIIAGATVCILGAAAVAGLGYKYIKDNINYNETAASEIALNAVPGEILRVEKDIEHGILEYEFIIRNEENMLVEVSVDSKYGAISDYEGIRKSFIR